MPQHRYASPRYVLADVATIELTPVGTGRWAHFAVTHIMRDGNRIAAPAVNTEEQAHTRRREFFPSATVICRPLDIR